jgi:hypothetical protein
MMVLVRFTCSSMCRLQPQHGLYVLQKSGNTCATIADIELLSQHSYAFKASS